MMTVARRLFLVVLAGSFAGCGGGGDAAPDLVQVTGTVKFDGKPLDKALVVFVPEKGGMSNAETDASGRFVLKYRGEKEGGVPGKNVVKISKSDGDAGAELLPPIFNSGSIITRDIVAPGPNDFEIDLDKEKAVKSSRDRRPQA